LKTILSLSFGGILYYLIAIYGMSVFSFHPSNITVLWLPFAVAVIFIHYFGNKFLPFVFVASIYANFSGMEQGNFTLTLLYTSISAVADTIAPYLSATLLKRYVDDDFDSVKGFLPFTLYGIIIPTFISSLIISVNLWIGHYISAEKIFSYVMLLMFADGLGLFLLYPVYKNFSKTPLTLHELKTITIFCVAIFGSVYFAFHFHFLIFLLPAMILILAFRMRGDIVAVILLITVIELIALSATHQSIFENINHDESLLMLMSFITSLVFIIMGITQHQRDLLKHQYHALTDTLTQTKNRLSYKETIQKYIDHFNDTQTPFSMLLFDIDDFKRINDTYSHRVGDIVLADLSSLIQQNIRNSDSLFRVGGEEFVILFPNTPIGLSTEIGEKLCRLVEHNLNTIADKTITISAGLSEIQKNDNEDSLYRRVDKLLYLSKQNGKNRISSDVF